MATIAILEHQFQKDLLPYMLHVLAERWRAQGHRVLIHHGWQAPPPADLAILHVDLTVIPPKYRAVLARYPRVLNGATLDISKRAYSDHVIERGSDWAGPAIVKSDANAGGRVDQRLREAAAVQGVQIAVAPAPVLTDYPVYERLADVPEATWRTRGLVVEKFLPERSGEHYVLRVWTFCGDRDRARLCRSTERVVKSWTIVDHEPCEVPEGLRALRRQLGFDYGKFDFVMHEGRCVLLDANRTPVRPKHMPEDALTELAGGLDAYLQKAPA